MKQTDSDTSVRLPAPLVSVIIPTYQRADRIYQTVMSALQQTFTDVEVIVIDDASTDHTVDVIQGIDDSRLRLIVHQINRGGNAARQSGIDAAKGTWVAFLDSDDLWEPDKLSKQLTRLKEAGPQYHFCYTWFDLQLDDGSVLPAQKVAIEGMGRPELLGVHLIGTFSTMMISRETLHQAGGLDPTLPSCQDWDLILRVSPMTGICVVPEVLTHYWHGDGERISTRSSSVVEGHYRIYQKLRRHYPELPAAHVESSQRYIMGVLAHHGATRQLLEIIKEIYPRLLSRGNLTFTARMVGRSIRRQISRVGTHA
ncbi:Undecaprenyl-phosphate 4-deoxy-4-formamido-L-arabinose transferase [Austwickia sp. TVS 96-490-7B]|uniref:glycosyltransferase family 2 protein n=1 Tax=Austwickia sp. TVS 96-490-7B TaxID=2830843 RepID=UPI001C596CC0|nr:glycosyltransferase family A protein [Austwickia sp. TVS 96-490-7B]MBW3084567.1 Undecaprenyl-phosphate 4-deoxy-4-formamido-L-arabinose transferase [Austwickia sp. TVS 96-490-7B]